jgi:cellulose biosynthesis protein BcsQ
MNAWATSYKRQVLLTWLDVERRLREMTHGFFEFPAYISGIHCYADGAEILVSESEHETALREWLSTGFGRALDESELFLHLDIQNTPYPFEVTFQSGKERKRLRYPLWHDLAYLDASPLDAFQLPERFPEQLRVAAFHSFKGGVGRTTALMTHLSAYLEYAKRRPVKVLVIDADLEAPGITYWLDVANHPPVSFVRFLESMHYPAVSVQESVRYFADELRKYSLTINGTHEIFVLPACIDSEQPIELLDTPVLPEHLARNAKNPWYVGDAIRQLSEALDANLVMVDLRAGLSELASPLLFDPRIERFIVSTVTRQSVNGAVLVLEKMAAIRSLIRDQDEVAAIPTVVLSLLTPALRESVDYDEAIQRLSGAYPNPHVEDAISAGVEFIEAAFDPNLMSIRDFNQALTLVKSGNLFEQALKWAESLSPIVESLPTTETLHTTRAVQAQQLESLCEKYVYAESGKAENLLVTEPLRNLAKHYEKSLPATISIGAKGAGKTFNFLQLCRMQTWERFLEKVGVATGNRGNVLIFPFLASKNLNPDSPAINVIRNCRDNCFQQLGLAKEFSDIDLSDRIAEALRGSSNWTQFWIGELLAAFDLPMDVGLKGLSDFLSGRQVSAIFLVDGLEDQFPNPADNEQRDALEALLRLTDRMNEIRGGNVGMIAFVRSDYVRTVIQQNVGQFETRYKSFVLEWTAESFLRLAYWTCAEARLPFTLEENPEQLSGAELLEKLYELWGQKLGSPHSKEAQTARWVFAALCDLNGKLQARDLVRFLFYAAQKSARSDRSSAWDDRVLLPDAIRRAVEDCSIKKVEEATKEIDVLNSWYTKLESIPNEKKVVPFEALNVGLTPELAKALQGLGIIFEDTDKKVAQRFYLPESYRTGLGFTLTASARPKVLALIQRNLGKLPF